MQLPSEKVARLKPLYEGRQVCVTGGAGFIGGHLLDALEFLGASVRVIDDLSNSTLNHLSEMVDLDPSRISFVMGSILDDRALSEAVRGCSVVFHLAAMGSVPRSVEDPQRAWAVNATGTLRVLEAARAAGATRVVYAASSSAYGDQPTLPKVETMLPSPRSPYAASKLAGEQLAAAWSATYGLSTVALRFFNVFGPRQNPGSAYAAVIPSFAARLLAGEAPVVFGDGSQTRDFTFVANAVYAALLAGCSDKELRGQPINVGSGERVTLLELLSLMQDCLSGPTPAAPILRPARAGDVRHSQADITRAREILGYQPIFTLEAGLKDACEWYRQTLAGSNQ